MAVEEKDSGLGLGAFLSGKTPEQKVEVAKDPPIESKDKQVEAKAKTTEPAGLDKDAKKEVAKVEGPNWDDDSNPWKKKAEESDKRQKDTHRDWNRLNQERINSQREQQELVRRLDVLNKKFDGTYDPQRDEPQAPDPVQVRQWGAVEGKVEASLAAAIRTRGEGEVMEALQKYATIFATDKGVQERVLASNDPIEGALEAVKHHEFFAKYGSDPSAIQQKFREEYEANELPKRLEAETKRIMDDINKKKNEPRGLSGVQGGSGATDKQVASDNTGRPKPLKALFGQ